MYYYNDFIKDIRAIILEHRNIVSLVEMSETYDGREIYAIKLGKGKVNGIISAGVHGREYINTPVLMSIIKEYIYGYNEELILQGVRIRSILDEISIVIVPLLNPDGYEIATKGFDAIHNDNLRKICKKKNICNIEWKYNCRGVDLNRNFESKSWKSKNINDYPFSEIESLFMKKIFDLYFGGIYIDIHSRGNNIYYYRNNMDESYNKKQLLLAKEIHKFSGYRISNPFEEINDGDSGGNTVHYYSEKYKLPAITIETVDENEKLPIRYEYVKKIHEELFPIINIYR